MNTDLSAQPGFKPYSHGATQGSPSRANPAKVANAAAAGVTEADRRPKPDVPAGPERALCACGHPRSVHLTADRSQCGMRGCGCAGFRSRGPAVPEQSGAAGRRADDLDDLVRPVPAPDPLAAFALHLKARMRALGWDVPRLREELGISAHIAGKAVNGTALDLGLAARIAARVGRELPEMLGAYKCGTCNGTPPAGFTCNECGTEGARI